ncbi:MAG: CHAT domain-containing protein [Proteobacteria bacterium]|nr:CHAT domain-containing protein [Pseudomonadota bacterium]
MAAKGWAVSFLRYLDFELKIAKSGDGYSAYVLRSPGGEASRTFTLPLSNDRIELLITRMGQRRRFEARRLRSPEMEAARELGASLFKSVFDEGVRDCLRSSLEHINERPGTGLRIKLRLDDAPELGDLPWELLYDGTNERFLAKSHHTPIVRYLELSECIRPLPLALPLEILVMISAPDGVATLDVEGEKAHLEQALGSLRRAGKVRLTYLPQATPRALQRALSIGTYHVIHYIGHGGFDKATDEGVLVLEDEEGKPYIADSQLLGTLIYDHRSLRLVVLNACEGARNSRSDPYAGMATALVKQSVPAVVAMQFEITDRAALTFADELYACLARGLPIDAAVSEARKAIYSQRNEIEWGTPVLYTRSDDGALFQLDLAAPLPEQPLQPEPEPEPQPQTRLEDNLDRQLDQLYDEALNQYFLERWSEARRCFRDIVELRADYENAAAMLQEVEQKARLTELYEQGVAHIQAEEWQKAHQALAALVAEQADFRDAATLLATARQSSVWPSCMGKRGGCTGAKNGRQWSRYSHKSKQSIRATPMAKDCWNRRRKRLRRPDARLSSKRATSGR